MSLQAEDVILLNRLREDQAEKEEVEARTAEAKEAFAVVSVTTVDECQLPEQLSDESEPEVKRAPSLHISSDEEDAPTLETPRESSPKGIRAQLARGFDPRSLAQHPSQAVAVRNLHDQVESLRTELNRTRRERDALLGKGESLKRAREDNELLRRRQRELEEENAVLRRQQVSAQAEVEEAGRLKRDYDRLLSEAGRLPSLDETARRLTHENKALRHKVRHHVKCVIDRNKWNSSDRYVVWIGAACLRLMCRCRTTGFARQPSWTTST